MSVMGLRRIRGRSLSEVIILKIRKLFELPYF